MGDANYSATAYSAYDRSRLLTRGISAVSGLAALVGVTYTAAAQDIQAISYRDTNLASYGVPSVDGLKPVATKWLDKTDLIPGKETRFDIFKVGDGMMGVYSIRDRQYGVVFDSDSKPPADSAYVDLSGDGVYEQISATKPFIAPKWVSQ